MSSTMHTGRPRCSAGITDGSISYPARTPGIYVGTEIIPLPLRAKSKLKLVQPGQATNRHRIRCKILSHGIPRPCHPHPAPDGRSGKTNFCNFSELQRYTYRGPKTKSAKQCRLKRLCANRDKPTVIPYTIVGDWVRYTDRTRYEGLFYQMSARRIPAPTVMTPPQTGTDE